MQQSLKGLSFLKLTVGYFNYLWFMFEKITSYQLPGVFRREVIYEYK